MIRLDEFDMKLQSGDEPDTPLKQWRGKFDGNLLTATDFVQFFEYSSPQYFSASQPINLNQGQDANNELERREVIGKCKFDEPSAKCGIIDIIEEFLCGDNPQNLMEKLKIEGNVSAVCGRVFKFGEPNYSCRECGMDPTCVLCVGCFKQSAHRYHKYKMGTSGGGGCCDCGDAEAWKRDPFCEEHTGIVNTMDTSSVITERMKQRCRIVFEAILHYCTRWLKSETDSSIKLLDGTDMEDDCYCTVLYNDETHTFEQVITTLTRIVLCSQADAIDYVSSVDREGRAVVKCAPFEECMKLKMEIEKNGSRTGIHSKILTLKVAVLHKNAVAFQQFALQLLSWFQEFLARHSVFRKIFCEIITQSHTLNYILMNDCKLWKTARTSWHRLLISAMLMEYDNKKGLAILFTKVYPTLMQDFIRDDHDHSYSIVSLSVQLFTVPTVAQHLIAHESAFFKLMHTFYSESIEKFVKKKVLIFVKNLGNLNVFKRSAYILFDLKYILSFKPTVWTDDLRKNFLHGVQILMKLLKEMQGMDSVFRQTGQHMEYEPEWESAFNLHIKLAHVITLVLDWCSTDKVVLVKVYRMVMASLSESEFIVSQTMNEVKELADHSASSLMYDVSSKHVSIHLPLSRFFAGLYLYLEKFDLTFDTLTITSTKPTPEQIIEPVLCTQTMIAQVHAGLWRRNGYSLLNQLYFYRNVKCRAEMLDRDIVVLQIGASLIESNEFLIHVMNKFNLITWATSDFEQTSLTNTEDDMIRQVINMVDEMLELLIVIVGERYMPGIAMVTEEDKLRKEIIQQLCIRPFSHSELSKTLPESQHETGIESVIETVAKFNKPTQSEKRGVYELKPEYFEYYNMYFYHYTKEDKSRSEEAQRARRKAKGELVCCPPPKLPQLLQSFSMLTNLLQCDVMLLIMQTVLLRAKDLRARFFSESHLQKVLHLIGYAIQEQQSGFYPFITFYDRAAKLDILPLMEELVNSARVEAHRDLLIWTVKQYKELQPIIPLTHEDGDGGGGVGCSSSTAGGENVVEMSESESSLSISTSDIEKIEKEQRAKLAAERRAKIMAQMAKAQKNFMSTNAALFESTSTALTAAETASSGMDWQQSDEENTIMMKTTKIKSIGCLGPDRHIPTADDQTYSCILCSEEAIVNNSSPCMVYSAFVQKSNLLNRHHDDTTPAPHTGTCGHVMHATCWIKYYENEVIKENRRPNRTRAPGNFQIDKREFLCPLCRYLSNTILPIIPNLNTYAIKSMVTPIQQSTDTSSSSLQDDTNDLCYEIIDNDDVREEEVDQQRGAAGVVDEVISFNDWLRVMQEYSNQLQKIKNLHEIVEDQWEIVKLLPSLKEIVNTVAANGGGENTINLSAFLNISHPMKRHQVSTELKKILNEFIESVRRVAPIPTVNPNCEPYLASWYSCSYTIESLEMSLRAMEKPLKSHMSIRHTSCLSSLIRVCSLTSAIATGDIAAKLTIQLTNLLDILFSVQSTSLSVLEFKPFKLLVSLVYLIPTVLYLKMNRCSIPNGGLQEFYFFKLMFAANLVKILILHKWEISTTTETSVSSTTTVNMDCEDEAAGTTSSTSTTTSSSSSSGGASGDDEFLMNDSYETESTTITSNLVKFYQNYNIFYSTMDKNENQQEQQRPSHQYLVNIVKHEMQTFLRCSCLLFYFMTDIEMPAGFEQLNGDTYELMCEYLGISSDLNSWFITATDNLLLEFMTKLANHTAVIDLRRVGGNFAYEKIQRTVLPTFTEVKRFVTLPEDYSDLINSVSQFTCRNNDRDDTRNPTLCLICGKILCSMTYCCQEEIDKTRVGSCTAHVYTCGAGVSIFLRIRDCELLFLGINKGSFHSAPYLDEYGETDQGLKRGNPLNLSKERLMKLHMLWLSHGLHEDIARSNESTNALVATQWQNM